MQQYPLYITWPTSAPHTGVEGGPSAPLSSPLSSLTVQSPRRVAYNKWSLRQVCVRRASPDPYTPMKTSGSRQFKSAKRAVDVMITHANLPHEQAGLGNLLSHIQRCNTECSGAQSGVCVWGVSKNVSALLAQRASHKNRNGVFMERFMFDLQPTPANRTKRAAVSKT